MSSNIVGIDLGTTYSCIGVWQSNQVEILSNQQGNRITPSYVGFTDKERLIGDGAKSQAAMNPENTIFDAKRLIGRDFKDESVQKDMKLWPFKIVKGDNDTPLFKIYELLDNQDNYKNKLVMVCNSPEMLKAWTAPEEIF